MKSSKKPMSPGLKPLKGKNVAPKSMPKQVSSKAPNQFVYNNVPKAKPKRGLKMLARGMKQLAAKK